MAAVAAGLALVVAGAVAAPLAASAEPVGVPVGAGDGGEAIAFGDSAHGRTTVPALPEGLSYTAAAAGVNHTVLLRSDGEAIAFGDDTYGQIDVPALPVGTGYTAVAAGTYHTVLLRSDGQAIAFGMDQGDGNTIVPALPSGVAYTGVAAGAWHTTLLRSDGQAVSFGFDGYGDGRLDVPALPPGTSYTQVAAGYNNTLLLRSDGQASISGNFTDGVSPVSVPTPPTGVGYVQGAMGNLHAVLLRSDGQAIAIGYGGYGQTSVPVLPVGESYTAVAAGQWNTVLLRSDGAAVVVGRDEAGQSTAPGLPEGMRYTAAAGGELHTVLIRSSTAAVDPVATTTSLDGPATADAGGTITLTATVTAATPGPDFTGTVRFSFEDSTTADATIDADGTVSTTRTLPAGGVYTATASYLGSTDDAYSASAASSAVTTTVPWTVTFDTGSGGSGVPSAQVAPGGLVPEPGDPTRTGHSFDDWRTGGPTGPVWDFSTDTVAGDLTLYAGWQLSSYTILFLVDGDLYSAYPIAYGEQLTAADLPPTPEKPGYDFDGWWDGATEFALPHTATGNVTLEARWEAWVPQLTLSTGVAAPGDAVVVTGSSFTPGEPVTLTLNPTLGTVVPDAEGAFSLAFTMPAVAPGAHTIAAHQGSASDPVVATAAITVLALAVTGVELLPLVAAGVGLLVLGAALLATRLRRRLGPI